MALVSRLSRKSARVGWRYVLALSLLAVGFACTEGQAQQSFTPCNVANVKCANQDWSEADRNTFYTTSQGSHMMPFAWFKALKRLDVDEPFAGDSLQRYGYLPNAVSASNPEGLPVGFVIDGDPVSGQIGMTCAACHTGQLEYMSEGVTHAVRIDGAPANADFQQFLLDLLAASTATVGEPDRFDTFSKAVLGDDGTAAKAAEIKERFEEWVAQFKEFMDKSLPPQPWGPGRLDAFGMIFNRVTARDIGVPDNFEFADAPVSYPFLWNASRQDRTQWNGGVENGLYIQALGRNSGEVFGVFAHFAPKRLVRSTLLNPALIDYSESSADLGGLQTLEEKIVALQPPPWPRELFAIDESLAAAGKPLFEEHCASCHGERASPAVPGRWLTPVKAVGTDPKMVLNSVRMADAGLLAGAPLPPPPIRHRVSNRARAGEMLAAVVVGSLTESLLKSAASPGRLAQNGVFRALRKDLAEQAANENIQALLDPGASVPKKLAATNAIREFISARLRDMFDPPVVPEGPAYESRVLHGIWATAPYLHNGSVPNLWELMKPADERTKNFMVGSRVFDPKNVGYDTTSSPFTSGSFVVDPANANGNGNGGHEYGIELTEDERWALVEYLKTL